MLHTIISFNDKTISSLVEGYFRNLIFNCHDNKFVLNLISKCNYEKISEFETNVYSISGFWKTNSINTVLDELDDKFGYSSEEVRMYLIAINKNLRGLLSWYNTGQKTMLFTVSLDKQFSEKDGRTILDVLQSKEISPKQITETQIILKDVYNKIMKVQPEKQKMWKKFFFEYGCDINKCNTEETTELNISLKKLRTNKELLTNIYEILRD